MYSYLFMYNFMQIVEITLLLKQNEVYVGIVPFSLEMGVHFCFVFTYLNSTKIS